jgi:hypothetical protein
VKFIGTIPRYLREERKMHPGPAKKKKLVQGPWKMQGSTNNCTSLTTIFAWILRPSNLSFRVTIGKQEPQSDIQLNCECCSTCPGLVKLKFQSSPGIDDRIIQSFVSHHLLGSVVRCSFLPAFTVFKASLDLPSGKVPMLSWGDHICLGAYTISV